MYYILLDLNDYERLFEHVLSDYNKNVEPFETPGSKVEVEFGVTPIYLDLDQNGILKVGRINIKLRKITIGAKLKKKLASKIVKIKSLILAHNESGPSLVQVLLDRYSTGLRRQQVRRDRQLKGRRVFDLGS